MCIYDICYLSLLMIIYVSKPEAIYINSWHIEIVKILIIKAGS